MGVTSVPVYRLFTPATFISTSPRAPSLRQQLYRRANRAYSASTAFTTSNSRNQRAGGPRAPPTAAYLGFRILNPSAASYRAFSASARNLYKDANMPAGPPKHQMVYFPGLITSTGIASGNFRKVLHTGLYSQLVTMEVPVGGDIGDEVHTVDQILIFTSGVGRAEIAGRNQDLKAGDVVIVPAGTQHQFVNTGDKPLELVTVYSPAEHNSQTVHKTKEEGDKEEDDGVDEAPEWSRRSKTENENAGRVKMGGGPYNE
ncbi:RmlC-like cupin [Rhizodiscina lignyota]|uniref:RmlC-like cupin n=1 Tax=Rhizodiscina lignyota TaxID=1504668 RepID=A0A9P4ITG9_9PEZI|nr:RmlC-like cupin [Rhizodiscina lignyota]